VKIDHLSFSKSGGAGPVASILGEAQRSMGRSVSFLAILDRNLFEQPFSFDESNPLSGARLLGDGDFCLKSQ
jgi:hypothetical protein